MTTILEADQWGMRFARPPVKQDPMNVYRLYLHHRAGVDPAALNPSWDDDAAAAFLAMNEAAISQKGYSATDYNLLTHLSPERHATVGIARGEYMPAATLDDNPGSKTVCLMGYFHPGSKWSRPPEGAEIEACAVGFAEIYRRGWCRPDAFILGHRDNPKHPGATACPGDYLYPKLPIIRARVAQLLIPHIEEEIPMELFTLTKGPAPLFERSGGLVRWVSLAEWQAMGAPPADRIMSATEAKRYRFVSSPADDPAAVADSRAFGSRC